jgi:hypothetical protein
MIRKLDDEEYNVEDYYKEKSCFADIARSQLFNNLTLLVILFNCAWLGVDADRNEAASVSEAAVHFVAMEYTFTVFYTIEIIVRFGSFMETRRAFRDFWFLFDLVLVVFMLAENAILPIINTVRDTEVAGSRGFVGILKMFRLLRLARVVRIVRAVPELLTLVKSITAAARSVIAIATLLSAIMYIFAVAFRLTWVGCCPADVSDGTHMYTGDDWRAQLACDRLALLPEGTTCHGGHGLFDTLGDGMFTLIQGAMSAEFPEGGIESHIMRFVYLCHLLLCNTLVLHMLIGLMCEIVTAVGSAQRDKQALSDMKATLKAHFDSVDVNNNGRLDIYEFFKLLETPEVVTTLQDMQIDVMHWIMHADYIFENSDEISFAKFLEVALSLRASNMARVSDAVEIRKLISSEMLVAEVRAEEFENLLFDRIDEVEGNLEKQKQMVKETLEDGLGEIADRMSAKLEQRIEEMTARLELKLTGQRAG